MHFFRELCNHGSYAELANHFLDLRIIGIGGTQLESAGLLDEGEMFEAHRGFACIIETWSELGAWIVHIGTSHSRRQRRRRLGSEGIITFFFVLLRFVDVFGLVFVSG